MWNLRRKEGRKKERKKERGYNIILLDLYFTTARQNKTKSASYSIII